MRSLIFSMLVGLLVLVPMAAFAGDLDSSAEPSSGTTGKMFNLEDIYNRLDTGAEGSLPTTAAPEPATGPAANTTHTLNDVMGRAPVRDDTDGATEADVASGKDFWGLTGGKWGLQTGTASGGGSCGVPETGQTTQYDANATKADDGGADPRGDSLPTPRFNNDNGDGTVTDNLTGLIWLQNAYCADTTRNWQPALDDVAQLNTDGKMNGNDCGDTSNAGSHQTDWRLPTLRELQSLIHYGYSSPALSNDAGTGKWTSGADSAFSDVQSSYYWTSTTSAGGTTFAWFVYLDYGYVDYGGKSFDIFHVWPVRAGQ